MDYQLFHLINQLAGHSALLDSIMRTIANYGPVVFILPLLYVWFRNGVEGKKAALLALASMGIALLIGQVIGHIYFRPRPFASHEVNLLVGRSADASFPSDHATFSFAIAWVLWFQDRRVGWVSLALGTIIAFSRVFVGTHYPLDVFGGAMLGLGTGLLMWKSRRLLDPVTSLLVAIAARLHL